MESSQTQHLLVIQASLLLTTYTGILKKSWCSERSSGKHWNFSCLHLLAPKTWQSSWLVKNVNAIHPAEGMNPNGMNSYSYGKPGSYGNRKIDSDSIFYALLKASVVNVLFWQVKLIKTEWEHFLWRAVIWLRTLSSRKVCGFVLLTFQYWKDVFFFTSKSKISP